jgi:predicted transcriptional regulator of viral defense system
LTEQVPRLVAIATTGGRKKTLHFQGWTYRFVYRTPRSFYGFREHELVGLNGAARVDVMIADPEKVLLDALDDEALAGGFSEVLKALHRGLRDGIVAVGRLIGYALRYPNQAVIARLGYLLERSAIPDAAALRQAIRTTGYPPRLSTQTKHADAYRDRSWNLLVNVPDDLLEESA